MPRPIGRTLRTVLLLACVAVWTSGALAAAASHTGFEWNADRKTVKQGGKFPTIIEPVRGEVWLVGLRRANAVAVQPLTAEGLPLGDPLKAEVTNLGYRLRVGTPPATWYVVTVQRR